MPLNITACDNRIGKLLVAGMLSLSAGTAVAEDHFDMEKISQCVACHGADGKGKAVQYPDLQGKPVDYMVAQLEYFKSGQRKNSSMNVVAQSLSTEDMKMLAEFFHRVK